MAKPLHAFRILIEIAKRDRITAILICQIHEKFKRKCMCVVCRLHPASPFSFICAVRYVSVFRMVCVCSLENGVSFSNSFPNTLRACSSSIACARWAFSFNAPQMGYISHHMCLTSSDPQHSTPHIPLLLRMICDGFLYTIFHILFASETLHFLQRMRCWRWCAFFAHKLFHSKRAQTTRTAHL